MALGVANAAWTIGWNVWRHRADRPRLRLDAHIYHQVDVLSGKEGGGQVMVKIANEGAKPITIVSVAVELAQNKGFLLGNTMAQLPKELAHGQFLHLAVAPVGEFTREVRGIGVFDGLGRANGVAGVE